jgi:hypothetical protein
MSLISRLELKNGKKIGSQTVLVMVASMRRVLRRDDPPANILKVWMWARMKRIPPNLILLQGFSKAYQKEKKEQKWRAKFLGDRMKEDLKESTYQDIRLDYKPRAGGKVGAGRRHHHAQNLAASVVRISRSVIPK